MIMKWCTRQRRTFGAALIGLAALTVPRMARAQTTEPLLGTWVLDLAHSRFYGTIPFYGGTPPGKRVMTFERVGDMIRHATETVDAENLRETWRLQYTFRIDGKPYKPDLQMPVDAVSFDRVAPTTVRRTAIHLGMVEEIVTYEV